MLANTRVKDPVDANEPDILPVTSNQAVKAPEIRAANCLELDT